MERPCSHSGLVFRLVGMQETLCETKFYTDKLLFSRQICKSRTIGPGNMHGKVFSTFPYSDYALNPWSGGRLRKTLKTKFVPINCTSRLSRLMMMDSLANQMSVKVKRMKFTVFGHQFTTVVAKKQENLNECLFIVQATLYW